MKKGSWQEYTFNRAAKISGARFEAKKEIEKYREEEERKFKDHIEHVGVGPQIA